MVTPNKSDCTGCSACYSICPVCCISMEVDAEGFLYPVIDKEKCTKCKSCERVCPAIVQGEERKPLKVYAAKNPNEEMRRQSSSGGIFTLLAEHTIQKGGVVFGARFNESWEVVHDYTETVEGLAVFRGSKYVQSVTGDTYKQAREFLEKDRNVLYSGTPCQIAGLKMFLQKDYDKLLTVDFVCHGVPSPLVWKKYLGELIGIVSPLHPIIFDIKFRDKIYGWNPTLVFTIAFAVGKSMDGSNILDVKPRNKEKSRQRYHFSITPINKDEETFFLMETSNTNSYLKGFLRNLFLRPSCHTCPVKSFKSGSDITIADYWGIRNVLPEFDDYKGTSLVMVNTEEGREIYGLLDTDVRETTYAEAFAGNSGIETSVLPHKKRDLFFEKLHKGSVIPLINRLATNSLRYFVKKSVLILLRQLKLLSIAKSVLVYIRLKRNRTI